MQLRRDDDDRDDVLLAGHFWLTSDLEGLAQRDIPQASRGGEQQLIEAKSCHTSHQAKYIAGHGRINTSVPGAPTDY